MSFTLYPAIDLKDGQCVRLVQGDMLTATVFELQPAAQAGAWQAAGFEWLHVVDLNGAFAGHAVNGAAVQAILTAVDIPVQLGGGIRDRRQIELWLEAGVSRVILGTVAARNPRLVKEMALAFPGRIAVGIDAKDFKVAVEGWAETSELDAAELAARFQDAGVAALIFTDVGRDGTGTGLNIEQTLRVARAAPGVPVIASGGLGALDDIEACIATGEIAGAICGRALYDGRISPRAALALARAG
jgi:phosphoribosylformimino-5-aminoimidazole carboxamide ribotide isomerase